MSYSTKPSFIKKGSTLQKVLLKTASGEAYVDDFDTTSRKDGLYPSARHGFVKIAKSGKAKLTKTGNKLLKTAK